jgi:hypothetical protein
MNRNVSWKGVEQSIRTIVANIAAQDWKATRRGITRQRYFMETLRTPKVNLKVRATIPWDQRCDKDAHKVLVTNRTTWKVNQILWVCRDRWTDTGTFHRDGKQELGMSKCQPRDDQGQTRHMDVVMMAYSLLTSQLKQARACEWALCKLMTIGEAA